MKNNTITLQVGVKVLLKNKENKYLLLRRSLEKYPDIKGRWDIVGGRIDAGTPLLDNLHREIEEETGLRMTEFPRLIAAQDILHQPERHVVRLTYLSQADGEVTLDRVENDQFQWLSWNELMQLQDMSIYLKALFEDQSLKERLMNNF